MIDQIRRLTLDDLPDCLALMIDRGWSPDEQRWRLLLDVGAGFGLREDAGDLIATSVLTRFGPGPDGGRDLAVVSMVLVARRRQRRRLGARLTAHALDAATDAVVTLNATHQGRGLYEQLGFTTVGQTYTHVGVFAPDPSRAAGQPGAVRPAGPDDLPAIRALDAAVIGADRSAALDRLAGTLGAEGTARDPGIPGAPGIADAIRVIDAGGTVTGFAASWRGRGTVEARPTQVGPVLAADLDDARALIAAVARTVDGPIRVDVEGRHPRLRAWLTEHGVPAVSATDLMVRDGELPGDRSRLYAPIMHALG